MLNAFRDFSNLTYHYSLQYGEKDGNAKTVLLADWHKGSGKCELPSFINLGVRGVGWHLNLSLSCLYCFDCKHSILEVQGCAIVNKKTHMACTCRPTVLY